MFQTSGSLGIVATSGANIEKIGTLRDAYYLSPIWSPDGASIAAVRGVGMELTSGLIAIRVDGGDEVVLATGVMYAAAGESPTSLPGSPTSVRTEWERLRGNRG